MRRKELDTILCASIAIFLNACNLSPTPSPDILGDSFFTGCAFLDKNANGLADGEDIPIGGMSFTVTLSTGAGFGAITSEKDGCASVLIPMRLPKEAWPVLAQMRISRSSGYIPVDDTRITLEYPDNKADFLFAQP